MKGNDPNAVPLLITMDLELAFDHDLNEQEQILQVLRSDFDQLGFKSTIFSTSDAGERFTTRIKELNASGHEIGCHGMNHGTKENFRTMSAENINHTISEATHRLQKITLDKPKCFRGPSMTTSSMTQKTLIDHGYIADFSVCSQRLDIFTSRGGHPGWLTAPRSPYCPSENSPYRKGSLPINVVPLSCIGGPFSSGMLYLFGLGFMKMFFHILFWEAVHLKKPIVYLFHSYEFTRYIQQNEYGGNDVKSLNAGIKQPVIQKLYIEDRQRRYSLNLALIKHMMSYKNVVSMTGHGYVSQLEEPFLI